MRSATAFGMMFLGSLWAHADTIAPDLFRNLPPSLPFHDPAIASNLAQRSPFLLNENVILGYTPPDSTLYDGERAVPQLSSDLALSHPSPTDLDGSRNGDFAGRGRDAFTIFGATAVPETNTLLLLGGGLCLVSLTRRRLVVR